MGAIHESSFGLMFKDVPGPNGGTRKTPVYFRDIKKPDRSGSYH